MKTRRPRRVIRGYRASKQFTGYGETRTREMLADGTHPRAMKDARASPPFFEDEIAGWQRQRANRGRAPHTSVLSMCPTKKCVRDYRPW
jgi:hypothetical protein